MEGVFVSRFLAPDSEFKAMVSAANIPIEAYSLIEFEAVPFASFPPTDWVFFYSKRAVTFFLNQVFKTNQFKIQLKNIKFACMGQGTATTLSQYHLNTHFIGNGKPDAVAAAFLPYAKGQRVLFPRANRSRKSIQKKLHTHILVQDLVVYSNKPKKSIAMISRHLLVFTSPLNAEAYFHQHELQPGQRIIAIGDSTAAALRKLGFCEFTVAAQPSERAMAEAVLADY